MAPSTPDSAWPSVWADLYDAMDVDRALHVSFYAGLAGQQTGSLLDLGCGTGSITMKIAAKMPEGARITGVDLSPQMVQIAKQRAPAHEWVVGDLCAPGVHGPFDLIVICFHTLQALTTNEQLHQAFDAVAGLLSDTGRFAFDIYQPNDAWLAAITPQEYVARQFTDTSGRRFNVVESNSAYDPETRVLSCDWRLQDAQSGEILDVEPIVQRVRQYYPQDISRALARSGLIALDQYGELDRRPLMPGTKRQVYVCAKAKI